MLSTALLALALAGGEVRPLLDPVTSYAGVLTTPDGQEVASVLAVTDSALDTGALSQEQQVVWNDLVARIKSQYAGADRRNRARLTLEVLKLQESSRYRSDDSIWLKLPDGSMTHAELVSYPESGTIWRIVDLSTGQYMARVRAGDTSELTPMFRELFKAKASDGEAVVARIRKTSTRLEDKVEGLVEVNGQQEYLAKGSTSPEAVVTALVALLPNLDGDGKDRIVMSLALLNALGGRGSHDRVPEIAGIAALCWPDGRAGTMPLPAVPTNLKLRLIASHEGVLEPPDPEVVKPFFGSKGWSQLDLDRSFKEQVTKLLSGS